MRERMNHNEIGIEALNQGNIEKAAEAFTKAIEESPKDPVPYINFANLLSSINEFERALNFFKKQLNLIIPQLQPITGQEMYIR